MAIKRNSILSKLVLTLNNIKFCTTLHEELGETRAKRIRSGEEYTQYPRHDR